MFLAFFRKYLGFFTHMAKHSEKALELIKVRVKPAEFFCPRCVVEKKLGRTFAICFFWGKKTQIHLWLQQMFEVHSLEIKSSHQGKKWRLEEWFVLDGFLTDAVFVSGRVEFFDLALLNDLNVQFLFFPVWWHNKTTQIFFKSFFPCTCYLVSIRGWYHPDSNWLKWGVCMSKASIVRVKIHKVVMQIDWFKT